VAQLFEQAQLTDPTRERPGLDHVRSLAMRVGEFLPQR
jgi:hypothetical protein